MYIHISTTPQISLFLLLFAFLTSPLQAAMESVEHSADTSPHSLSYRILHSLPKVISKEMAKEAFERLDTIEVWYVDAFKEDYTFLGLKKKKRKKACLINSDNYQTCKQKIPFTIQDFKHRMKEVRKNFLQILNTNQERFDFSLKKINFYKIISFDHKDCNGNTIGDMVKQGIVILYNWDHLLHYFFYNTNFDNKKALPRRNGFEAVLEVGWSYKDIYYLDRAIRLFSIDIYPQISSNKKLMEGMLYCMSTYYNDLAQLWLQKRGRFLNIANNDKKIAS